MYSYGLIPYGINLGGENIDKNQRKKKSLRFKMAHSIPTQLSHISYPLIFKIYRYVVFLLITT